MQQITQIATKVLKVHPRNQEFFDDIEGKTYEQFKVSIKNEGVVTPLIVAPDMTVVSGHQRLKACKDLEIEKVPVIIREDLDDEDEKLKKLLATNFGREKNSPAKQVKVAAEYVGLVGNKQGRPNKRGETRPFLSREDIAKELGVSETTLKELLKIDRKLIPEIRQLFDDGKITKQTANKVWCRLSATDQEKFFNEIGRDKISQMTQKQTQEYIDNLRKAEQRNNQLEQELQCEKSKPPKVETKVIDNTDYETIEKLKNELKTKTDFYNKIVEKEKTHNQLMEMYKHDSEEYKKLKREMELITKQKNDLSRSLNSTTELSGLIFGVERFIKEQLAPIKYSRAIMDTSNNDIVQRNLSDIVAVVQKWCDEMNTYLTNKNNEIIDVKFEEEV